MLSEIDNMMNIKVHREYWEGVRKRIPKMEKVLPITIGGEMSKTIQGLPKGECPVLFVPIPSGMGANLSVGSVRENNLCVILLMNKYDPQRKGAYEAIEEVQLIMECTRQMLIEGSTTGCPVTKELNLTSLSTPPESGFYRAFAGWSLAFPSKMR